ncbi:MAG: NAD-dependent DNA ligase LigA [Clostridia bacterium]|nr:NAD-dependent DNA ligase LigA [Clostridia bacterium]
MSDIITLMKEKIDILNRAGKAYYAQDEEIMTNLEYDMLYDELVELEKQSGIVLAGSPTQKVGYEVVSELPKERHPSRMLSLDKTKDRESLPGWLGDRKGLLSWKMDGLTVVLTYKDGKLAKAVTRGNGEVGEVITGNASTFINLPLRIAFPGELVIRGEAVISYADFEEINDALPEGEQPYKNPRNLCAGSVRQLDSSVTAKRNVQFHAFALVSADGAPEEVLRSREEGFKWLAGLGFAVVGYRVVTAGTVVAAVDDFESRIANNPLPSDGLVLTLDDAVYSATLGTTAKFPRDSIAFKWRDQLAETALREIEWSASRTGLINPVAIFDPVELEGTTVSRASLHNVSIMEELKLGIGDTIRVYKANMIIPQVLDNLTMSGPETPPAACPVCGSGTLIKDENGVRTLVCPNPDCLAKQIKKFTLFVSREAMNIDGLSEMTIEKFIARGIIKEPADLFKLEEHRDVIVGMEGFGEKSYENLLAACRNASETTPDRLLLALGIPGIGTANAKLIAKHCRNSWEAMERLSKEELMEIEGIGGIMAESYTKFFADEENRRMVKDLTDVLKLDETFTSAGTLFEGMTFVITGGLNNHANRDELKALIEEAGGKVAGSVSARTTYLINNDITSTSGKNKKARELGIPIIDEETVDRWLKEGVVTE